ncbi:MAG: DUF2877 domain-containing protein [Chloroflexota bacterium]
MTQFLVPISIAPKAKEWLGHTRQAWVLHVFQSTLNLINDDSEVFSIVTPAIGSGPFSLVVKNTDFRDYADAATPIKIENRNLSIGVTSCPCHPIPTWEPRPDWDALRIQKQAVIAQMLSMEAFINQHAPADSMAQILNRTASESHFLQDKFAGTAQIAVQSLSKGLRGHDLKFIEEAAVRLVGLGLGLTPSGDDYLMGVIFGLWIGYPKNFAVRCAELIYQTAREKTNHLSAAWLGAAADEEAGEIWHHLFGALISHEKTLLQQSIARILAAGHSSGGDALAGFILALGNAR